MDNSTKSTPFGVIKLSLENCILPKEKLDKTPSSIDGLEYNHEYDLRVLGTELIQTSGILLRLPQVAMATGQVLFHRFYYSKSFVRYPMEITAMACILLASKIEEAPRRIRDVANVFHHMKQIRTGKSPVPLLVDSNYIDLKNQIIRGERRLLKELGFCVHVKHPHKFVVNTLRALECERNQRLVQTSWNYMNDSLRTDVFCRYPPETIACACIYLSARMLRIPLPTTPPWFEVFGVVEDDIQSICKILFALYARDKPDQEKLEAIIENLRKDYENSKAKPKDNGENENKNGTKEDLVPTINEKVEERTNRVEEVSPEHHISKLKRDIIEREVKVIKRKTEESPHRRYESKKSRSLKSRNGDSPRRNSPRGSPRKKATPPRRYMYERSRSRSRDRSRERIEDWNDDRERIDKGRHRRNHHSRRHKKSK